MSTANHQLITDLMNAWNAHDAQAVALLHAVDFVGVDVSHSRSLHGRDAFQASVIRMLAAFPDLHFSSDVLVDKQRAAVVWVLTATHQGRMFGIPPTGRSFAVRGVSTLTIEQGLITHGLYIWDVAGFLRAVGLLPEL
jgi:steroid delta-isomerase-like uncharacterized protein